MRPTSTPAMRSFVESTFTCRVKITRADGPPDPLTGLPSTATIYDGKALVYARDLDSRQVITQTTDYSVSKYVVVVPAHTPVKVRDFATVTASPDQPTMTGLKLRLVDVPLDAWGIALQCIGEHVT